MHPLTQLLVTFTALLFFFIFYLETIATSSKHTARMFQIPVECLREKQMSTLMRNQGVYNGFVGVWLLYGAYFSAYPREACMSWLIFAVSVAVYGALSSSLSILYKQGGLPLLSLLSLFILG